LARAALFLRGHVVADLVEVGIFLRGHAVADLADDGLFLRGQLPRLQILYPCSDISDNALHKLKNVQPKIIYKTEFIKQPKINLTNFKGIVFSSPSTVKSFLNLYKKIPNNLICYVFGKHTQKN